LTSDELIHRAERAKQLLQEPLIVEALQKLEQDVMEAWSTCAIRDKEAQHELLLMVQTARKFRALFAQVIATGEIEAAQLKTPKLTRVLGRFGI
jgi:hypothetical protein